MHLKGSVSMKRFPLIISGAVIAVTLSANAFTSSDSIFELDPARVANAQSAADHEKFANDLEAEAVALDKKVVFHQSLADTYGAPGGKSVQASIARHCRELAKEYKAAAEENRQLAAEQRTLGRSAAK